MSKEELEKFPNHIENNSNETESTKNLCVHELRRRLKNKIHILIKMGKANFYIYDLEIKISKKKESLKHL